MEYHHLSLQVRWIMLKHCHLVPDVLGCQNKLCIGFHRKSNLMDRLVHSSILNAEMLWTLFLLSTIFKYKYKRLL